MRAVPLAARGTFLPCRVSPAMSAIGGKTENKHLYDWNILPIGRRAISVVGHVV